MAPFVLDSNFFIQAHRSVYPLDIAVGFWEKVKKLADEEKICTIDKVRDEIFFNEDTLKTWLELNLAEKFYKDTNLPDVLQHYGKVVQWAQSMSNHYLPKAINDFLQFENADSWLVAYSCSNADCVIVIQEISSPNSRSSIKIPDVSRIFNVNCINTIEMFRKLGETF